MSIIKSLSVGNGDMFYICHDSSNFTIIDCNLHEDNKESIIDEIREVSKGKRIIRFISTHPDEDHIGGLHWLDDNFHFLNFYCVKNEAEKDEDTESFKRYKELRDTKAFFIEKGCSRKWLNITDSENGSSGIFFLWPITSNPYFQNVLEEVKEGYSPNNISPIFTYNVYNGAKFMWMGDIETDFLKKVKDQIAFEHVDVLFAPHHGRKSGRVPSSVLKKLTPSLIVVGEADSEDLNYYPDYLTITQNTAGDIVFECLDDCINIYYQTNKSTIPDLVLEID